MIANFLPQLRLQAAEAFGRREGSLMLLARTKGVLEAETAPEKIKRFLTGAADPRLGFVEGKRHQRYYGPLRLPIRPVQIVAESQLKVSRAFAAGRSHVAHDSGFGLLSPTTPSKRTVRIVRARGSCQPSPSLGRVGLRIVHFGAVSAFADVTACQIAAGLRRLMSPRLKPCH
jgi:hypothetical protein